MKLPVLLTCALLAAGTALANAQGPSGALKINAKMVRCGAKPLLSWTVSRPASTVEDIITIADDDSIVAKRDLELEVRLLGASYQPFGYDAPVSFQLMVGGSSWETAFQGTDGEINPTDAVYSTVVRKGTAVNFAGAGNYWDDHWTTSRTTLSENLNIVALKDGDAVPTSIPAFRQGGIEEHVAPYIEHGKISLGPRDVLYLVEIGQTNTKTSGFDLQDLVVVVTFNEASPGSIASTHETTETPAETGTDPNAPGERTTARQPTIERKGKKPRQGHDPLS